MSTTLGKVASGAVALTLVFGLAACGESSIDLQRKPELVDLLVDRAVATCQMQQSELDQAPYANRLKDVLFEAPTKTLDYFKDNNITICLDKRLNDQHNGFFTTDAKAIYYPSEKTLTLWDNGKAEGQKWFYESTAASRGYKYLNEFPEQFGGWFSDYKSVNDIQRPMIGYSYSASCGKNCTTTRYAWENMDDFMLSNAIADNPILSVPPVIGAP